jgi:CcmD family protein
MKRSFILILLLLNFVTAFAQDPASVEMADTLRSSGKIYVVIGTIVIIFIGLAIYLFAIDRRLRKIEKENSI